MEIVFVLVSIMGLVMIIVGAGYIATGLKEVKKISSLINKNLEDKVT